MKAEGKSRRRRRASSPDRASHDSRVRALAGEVLDTLMQIRRLEEGEVANPAVLQAGLKEQLEPLRKRAVKDGLSQEEANQILYALAAFADEVGSHSKSESVATYWNENKLQMTYFNENLAGEHFFDRLEELLKAGESIEAILAYYYCLNLGFKGQYAVTGGDAALIEIVEKVRAHLSKHGMADPDSLSVRAERVDTTARDDRRHLLLLAIPICAVVFSLLAYLLFGRVQPEIDATIATIDEIVHSGG